MAYPPSARRTGPAGSIHKAPSTIEATPPAAAAYTYAAPESQPERSKLALPFRHQIKDSNEDVIGSFSGADAPANVGVGVTSELP